VLVRDNYWAEELFVLVLNVHMPAKPMFSNGSCQARSWKLFMYAHHVPRHSFSLFFVVFLFFLKVLGLGVLCFALACSFQ